MFITNAYVLYLKTCGEYRIPKVTHMTRLEFLNGIVLAWINPEVHVEEWKAKDGAYRKNNKHVMSRIKRVY